MNRGFTLIELIVVIALISIFTGVGYTTYTRNIQSAALDKETDSIVNAISLVRQKASSRDLSHYPTCPDSFRYYIRFFYTTDPQMYRKGFDCISYVSPSPRYVPFGDTEFSSVSMISPTADTNLYFYPPYGCSNATCTGADFTVKIKNEALNKCKDVVVNRLGNVTVQDVSCP